MDITSINAALASLKAAKDIGQGMLELKTASEIQTKVIELQTLILAAQSSALDAKAACIDFVEQNADLRKQNLELRERLEQREHMVFRDNVYWRVVDGKADDGPFCPKCFDGSNRPARMTVRAEDSYKQCPVCDFGIKKPGSNNESDFRFTTRIRPYGH